ncbi:MAG: hypothetical protein KF908_10365 [Nitrosomonas sp.]|nr:hypothetical protein [Nitrosomonas sp.]
MLETYDAINESIEKRLDELEHTAIGIVDRYWNWLRDVESRNSGWENKSNLRLRCERKGNSLRIDWTGLKWQGSKASGTRRPLMVYISKPKGKHAYTLTKLYQFAKDWEKPMIEETENQLVPIRWEASHLVKAMIAVRNARAVAAAAAGEDK